MRGPRDKDKSRNAFQLRNHTMYHFHGAVLVTETSPESMWEESTYKHEYQEVRIIGLILETSYHNVPYQSITDRNRHPIPSIYNHPSPNPNHSLAVISQLLVFPLIFFLSLRGDPSSIPPPKLEPSLALLALSQMFINVYFCYQKQI